MAGPLESLLFGFRTVKVAGVELPTTSVLNFPLGSATYNTTTNEIDVLFDSAGTLLADNIDEYTPEAGVTVAGVLHAGGDLSAGAVVATLGVQTDAIAERTAGAGVTIDSVLLKDGGFVASGATLDTSGITFAATRFVKSATGALSLLTDGDVVVVEAGPTGGTKTGLLVRRNDDLSQGQEAWTSAGIFRRRSWFPKVSTTDATVTTLWSFTLADNATYQVTARVIADQTSGSANSAGYERIATVKRSGGGATLVGAVSTPHTAEDVAGWDCTFDVSGNDVRLRVTGAAASPIDWDGDVILNSRSS